MALSGKTKGPSILEHSLMWSVPNMPKTYEDKEEAAVPHSLLQPEPTEFLELKVISLCSRMNFSSRNFSILYFKTI